MHATSVPKPFGSEKIHLIGVLNFSCSSLFYILHDYLVKNETENLKIITDDPDTTLENYPYFYDRDDVIEFSHRRCQDSSKIMGQLLLNTFEGRYESESKKFVIKVAEEEYFLSYMVFGKDEHAFLKISDTKQNRIEIVIDPSYKQFAAVINIPKGDCFLAGNEENQQLKKASSVFVGTPDEITSYFRNQLPKTNRTPKDCERILEFWQKAKEQNSTLLTFSQNIEAFKRSGAFSNHGDQAVIYMSTCL